MLTTPNLQSAAYQLRPPMINVSVINMHVSGTGLSIALNALPLAPTQILMIH